MSYIGGLMVGFAVVFTVLIPLTTRLSRDHPGRTGRGDWVLGLVVALGWVIAVTATQAALWPDSRGFVDGATFGISVAPVAFLPDIVSALRRRRNPHPTRHVVPVFQPREPRRFIEPVAFSSAVHDHFADPMARARYVVAAYRRGLIPAESVPGLAAELALLLPDGAPAWVELAAHDGGAGLGDVVDRAAGEIGYAPTEGEERADVVDRLVYTALAGTDPGVRVATVALLAPSGGLGVPSVSNPPATISVTRATIEGFFAAGHGVVLADGVHRHFADPAIRARRLIAAYRRGDEFSRDIGRAAAHLIADLPDAGPAWTELAMAGPDAARSELGDVVERAATEIRHDSADESELLIEHELYRALCDGDVLDRSRRIWSLDARSPFAVPFILAGHDGDIGIATFFADGVEYLDRRCSLQP